MDQPVQEERRSRIDNFRQSRRLRRSRSRSRDLLEAAAAAALPL